MVGEFNDNNLKGIIPRSFDYIFQRIEENHKKDPCERYNISIAYNQAKNEFNIDMKNCIVCLWHTILLAPYKTEGRSVE